MAFGQTLKDGEYTLCWATHPKMPNRSGHSRSRTHHLTLDRKVTLCKMKFDAVGKEGFERGLCYNCRSIRDRQDALKESK